MSLARARFAYIRPRSIFGPTNHRLASTASQHKEHHEESHHREDFNSPIWRNTLIATAVIVAAYRYAPAPGEDVYLTKWIGLYKTPIDTWLDMNANHTAKQQEVSESNILLNDAQKERAHRYRYPEIINQSSPFLNGVGM
ncbi:hypothetical protein AMATHDRAFT_57589 [Amanita thiersii Skay4041]|uniref:Uncharacterized protein n=1 Tax=Amanita thiersii Skay4041 TaxID=703135 RepID=A0A2A9NVZ9_9AGAR|nr:hypothetical protein AMATHDRAFT_57589 [Amanita thiersii Skay4041]